MAFVTTRILGGAEAKPEPSIYQPRAKRDLARSSRDKKCIGKYFVRIQIVIYVPRDKRSNRKMESLGGSMELLILLVIYLISTDKKGERKSLYTSTIGRCETRVKHEAHYSASATMEQFMI